jgi:hypothetical protein
MRLRRLAAPSLLAILLQAAAARPAAQPPRTTPFAPDDILNVVTVSVLDLSDDGTRVAVALRRTLDNADTDNYRSGDPTYAAPSRVELQIIDTRSGAKQVTFKGLASVRQAAWSHDGKRLAILVVDNLNAAAPIQPLRPRQGTGRRASRRRRKRRRGGSARCLASTCGTPTRPLSPMSRAAPRPP